MDLLLKLFKVTYKHQNEIISQFVVAKSFAAVESDLQGADLIKCEIVEDPICIIQ